MKYLRTNGKTKLLEALDRCISEFDKMPFNTNLVKDSEFKHNKIIFLVTDGFENNSRQTPEFLSKRLESKKISMIVLGMTKNPNSTEFLKNLAQSSKDGIYYTLDDVNATELIFSSFREKKREPFLIVESF